VTARGVAIEACTAVDAGARANAVLAELLERSGLSDRDRALATELAYGTTRMRRACDWLVDQFARGEMEPSVQAAARVGAYQLAYMRAPAYAAVSATVAEAPPRARSFLNAVLRRVAELVEAGPIVWPDLPTGLSYPDWVVRRMVEDLGAERALTALKQMNKAAPMTVRADGYAQGPSSQAVGSYVLGLLDGAAPGPVLDACAGPGGKATLLARRGGLVVGTEVAPARARLVSNQCRRLGLSNVAVAVADAGAAPWRAATFAGVLVDAPCSGLGVLHRRPDARWRAQPGDIVRLAALQRRLLAASAPLVRPGGVLVYSVCTLTRDETVVVGDWLAGEVAPGGWDDAPLPGAPWQRWGRGALLLPQADGGDGMFVLALRRRQAP
jgi:16S rRNA (cytosine967-C5)-methyltransferase